MWTVRKLLQGFLISFSILPADWARRLSGLRTGGRDWVSTYWLCSGGCRKWRQTWHLSHLSNPITSLSCFGARLNNFYCQLVVLFSLRGGNGGWRGGGVCGGGGWEGLGIMGGSYVHLMWSWGEKSCQTAARFIIFRLKEKNKTQTFPRKYPSSTSAREEAIHLQSDKFTNCHRFLVVCLSALLKAIYSENLSRPDMTFVVEWA